MPMIRIAAALGLMLALAAAAQPLTVPGTRVSLEPPPGFAPAEQFPGFVLAEQNASIVVTELPGPYAQVTAGFDADALATRGIGLVEKQTVDVAGMTGQLVLLSQTARSVDFLKWIVAVGDDRATLLITATFPADAADALAAPLRAAVLSAGWQRDATAEFFAGMPFTLTPAAPLAIAQKIGANVLLTVDGAFPAVNPHEPLMIAGSSLGDDRRVADRAGFARARILQYPEFDDVVVADEQTIRLDGLDGVTLRADAVDARSGTPLFLHQTLLFDDDGYILILGISRGDARDDYAPLFDRTVASFRRQR